MERRRGRDGVLLSVYRCSFIVLETSGGFVWGECAMVFVTYYLCSTMDMEF